MNSFRAYLKKDGWILALLLLCVAMCIFLGSQNEHASTEENQICRVLSAIDGAGTVEVAVHYQDAVPCGAVIVADGAGDVAVKLKLMSAVTTLLNLEPKRVTIHKREKSR